MWPSYLLLFTVLVGTFIGVWVLENKEISSPKHIPVGHLQPLGSHRPAETKGIPTYLEGFPHPADFFSRHVKSSIPAVFRGVAQKMQIFHTWSDDYLESRFGNSSVFVELQKKEKRDGNFAEMSLSEFLSRYQTNDWYLVHTLYGDMHGDVEIPGCLQCGFSKYLVEATIWLSSGGTTSVLHQDAMDNINCLLDGTKQVFLVNRTSSSQIKTRPDGLDSLVDVDEVDLYKYPELQNIHWYNVTLTAGDCMYLPFLWHHSVRSFGRRNLAVNIWFAHLRWYNDIQCEEFPSLVPFSNFHPLSIKELDKTLYILKSEEFTSLSKENFENIYELSSSELQHVFSQFDHDGDGYVTLKEMYDTPVNVYQEYFFQTEGSKTITRDTNPMMEEIDMKEGREEAEELQDFFEGLWQNSEQHEEL